MPTLPSLFELPEAWLVETGIDSFNPGETACHPKEASAVLVQLSDIEPIRRMKTCNDDGRGFDLEKMKSILRGIAARRPIEAIPLIELPELDPVAIPLPRI
jgi:hypothetical protein